MSNHHLGIGSGPRHRSRWSSALLIAAVAALLGFVTGGTAGAQPDGAALYKAMKAA